MNGFVLVISTCSSAEEARRIAHALVELRLAACAQILPAMLSVYRWKGNVESATEHLLLVKTSRDKFDAIQAKIVEMHSYEVPEIVAVPIEAASDLYLEWMKDALRG